MLQQKGEGGGEREDGEKKVNKQMEVERWKNGRREGGEGKGRGEV